MDHNQFLEAVRKHLELSPEDEILGVYIQVRRNQIVKIAGSNSVIIDGSGDIEITGDRPSFTHQPSLKDVKPTKKYKKRKHSGASKALRMDLTTSDGDMEYAKKKLYQWGWTKKFNAEEKYLWDDLKGGAIKTMEVGDRDKIINFYHRVAKRLRGE